MRPPARDWRPRACQQGLERRPCSSSVRLVCPCPGAGKTMIAVSVCFDYRMRYVATGGYRYPFSVSGMRYGGGAEISLDRAFAFGEIRMTTEQNRKTHSAEYFGESRDYWWNADFLAL